MRLFVAIDFPEGLKRYLSEVGNLLKTDAATVAVAQEHHLTLKFLGEQTETYAQDLERKLSRVAFKPFEGHLTKIGTFTDSGRVRVVWGGIEPVNPFAALAKEIDKITPEVKNDYPEYNPHITFARVKRIVSKEAFKDLLASIKLEEKHFAVQEFKLYRSVPGFEGHRYEILRTFPAQDF
jgi:2'-5' RNA ligase